MTDYTTTLNERIAGRIRALRSAQGLALEGLAERSGVSRSMISLIERGESSPTAVVLEKLATALGITMATLFASDDDPGLIALDPIARYADQPCWEDPASGYARRSVTPAGASQPMQIVDVHFPAHARVAFESGSRAERVCQQIWMREGEMDITIGTTRSRLHAGDCLAMELDRPTMFHNPTAHPARYAVVIASLPASTPGPSTSASSTTAHSTFTPVRA
jgi:transcriptional regulator with XRE-family HTH domain